MQCQNNLNTKYICMIYNLITKVYSDEHKPCLARHECSGQFLTEISLIAPFISTTIRTYMLKKYYIVQCRAIHFFNYAKEGS